MFWIHNYKVLISWLGLSPTSGSDSDGNVGSKEQTTAADVILATPEDLEISFLFEWS